MLGLIGSLQAQHQGHAVSEVSAVSVHHRGAGRPIFRSIMKGTSSHAATLHNLALVYGLLIFTLFGCPTWAFLHKRWRSLENDDSGDMATAKLTGIKFAFGIVPDASSPASWTILARPTTSCRWAGKQGVHGDKAKALDVQREAAPESVREVGRPDEVHSMRCAMSATLACLPSVVSDRLRKRYLEWYSFMRPSKGGDGTAPHP